MAEAPQIAIQGSNTITVIKRLRDFGPIYYSKVAGTVYNDDNACLWVLPYKRAILTIILSFLNLNKYLVAINILATASSAYRQDVTVLTIMRKKLS
jgi:hypothetical protein